MDSKTALGKGKKFVHALVVLAFLITGLVALYVGSKALIAAELTTAVTALGAGLLLLLASIFDQFESFKGLGIEAVVRRAETAVAELRELAEVFATLILTLHMRAGRMDGNNDEELGRVRSSALQAIKRAGVDEGRFPDVLRQWDDTIEFDYAYYIVRAARRGADPQPSPANVETLNKLNSTGYEGRPSPGSLRSTLSNMALITPTVEELLLDYEHFVLHREHRRPVEWKHRSEWSATGGWHPLVI